MGGVMVVSLYLSCSSFVFCGVWILDKLLGDEFFLFLFDVFELDEVKSENEVIILCE